MFQITIFFLYIIAGVILALTRLPRHAAQEKIRIEGLISMRRQYVHLSPDKDTASEVGRRRAKIPVILTVRARQAAAAGCSFYHRNSQVWLSDDIEPSFLDLP